MAAAASGIEAGVYGYYVDAPDGSTSHVLVHAPSRSADFQISVKDDDDTFPVQIRVAAGSNFIKIRFTKAMLRGQSGEAKEVFSGKHWYRLGVKDAGLSDYIVYPENPDPLGMKRLLAGVTAATGDAETIKGKIDGTKLGTEDPLIGRKTFRSMISGYAIPFTAVLDDQGRILKLIVDIPASLEHKAGRWVFTFDEYGTVKPQPALSGPDVRKASPSFQRFLLEL
ncbi:hypothetical protein Acsp02_47640 [Actinoplanes sp. NBRC 103695]|nr:hypothetical protein Acsp02_47640 [Actinoplanes sp. NBRC 103695]